MDPNATHLERLVSNTSCRKALQEDLSQHRKKKILEAAQERRSLKKCRRDLNDFSIPLSALKREDGTVTTSRFEMERLQRGFIPICSVLRNPYQTPISPLVKLHQGFYHLRCESRLGV
ncbi:unnamed protein product [Nippostrongylus brasiliensis]|uniref:UBX domain-containing protein n=1 Tax=Nippostrongylus brasiliensis TaxID=27835 RepID=A0A0N4YBA8_NIPBR|nr:unnamed protein product [Nippostrongylus brasiliensis]